MSKHYDTLETRTPTEREKALMQALPQQVAHAKQNAPFFTLWLKVVDPAEVTSRAALASRCRGLLQPPPSGAFPLDRIEVAISRFCRMCPHTRTIRPHRRCAGTPPSHFSVTYRRGSDQSSQPLPFRNRRDREEYLPGGPTSEPLPPCLPSECRSLHQRNHNSPPRPTVRNHAKPAAPCDTMPCHPLRAMPRLPRLAERLVALPIRTSSRLPRQSTRCRSQPSLSLPRLPGRAYPCQTPPCGACRSAPCLS